MYGKWPHLALVTLIFLLIIPARSVYARKPPEITVISEIMFGSQEDYVPETVYEEGGELYRLKDWKLETVTVGPREKQVEQEVFYEEVEKKEMIPGIRRITSKEEFSGQKINEKYPVLKMKAVNEEWREDFSFPVVFHSYGAAEYQLGESVVASYGEPLKPEECEEALLSEIGVTSENYRITKTEWTSAPYIDENHVLCRNAVASGKRKVADYLVTYGGTVTFPEVEGFRCRAVYRMTEFKRTPAQEKTIAPENAAGAMELDPAWIIKREAVVYTVSLILLLMLLTAAAWLIKRIVEKKARNREDCGN